MLADALTVFMGCRRVFDMKLVVFVSLDTFFPNHISELSSEVSDTTCAPVCCAVMFPDMRMESVVPPCMVATENSDTIDAMDDRSFDVVPVATGAFTNHDVLSLKYPS